MSFGRWLLQLLLLAAALGIPAFPLGEMLPRRWFHPERFPYRSAAWEQGGAFYEKLHIRRWKDSFPDMSRLIPKAYTKKIGMLRDPEHVRRLIAETCSAEAVHWVLLLLSLPLFPAVMGPWGWLALLVYNLAGNLPPIIIQRYNRPRMALLLAKMERAARKKEGVAQA